MIYFRSIFWRKVFFGAIGVGSGSRMRTISRIQSTQIIMKPYLYPWCEFINVDICQPKFTSPIRRRKIVTIRIRPCSFAHSVNADLSGLRYLVWSHANPVTTAISTTVNILDSGTPSIIGSATFENHFSSMSSAVKRITKSHTHCIEGYSSSFLAI